MNNKLPPFTKDFAASLAEKYPTPFYIYDEKAIKQKARDFQDAFGWVPGGFKNFFAVKALPNPHILRLLKAGGMGADCSSLPELILAEKAGLSGEDIMFTSNDTPAGEFVRAKAMDAIINLDDITHLEFLEKHAGLPGLICMRYNPGPLKGGNAIIGKPEEAKYGFTRPQILEGFGLARAKGIRRFGLHTMVASNELNPDYFVETAVILFELAVEILKTTGVKLEFVNLGGGIGIPYKPGAAAVDLFYVSQGIHEAYDRIIVKNGLDPLRIFMENGRCVTGPYGYLVSRVIHEKNIYKRYIGLDACMANLMRPGMYGAYHHITVLGKEDAPAAETCDVTGSLCENNDKFAVDRELPRIAAGDLVVIHDGGAHGHAMGFNYNGKLRCAEFLLKEDGSVKMIRRAETAEDYFATLVPLD
ncbi:MAG: diaminopimelate decarboxylase [Spirochaetales bacterium]|jgi:diaminopimelate decarboxylase|nr:diaminopimelate decarboxylase [Spirochaetales bacterium]